MDGALMDGRVGKLWLCKREGHALGVVLRVTEHGHYEYRLALFRHAVEARRDAIIGARVIASLTGTAYDIECEICGARRTWWWGAAGMERLLERREERRKNERSADAN